VFGSAKFNVYPVQHLKHLVGGIMTRKIEMAEIVKTAAGQNTFSVLLHNLSLGPMLRPDT
jgi:hypothetical protein